MRTCSARLLASLALVAAVLSLPVPSRAERSCLESSWTAGTTEWCAGSLVYRDHVYDDTGADTSFSSPHGTGLNGAAGDVDHREHGQALNSADLLVLRVKLDGRKLHARFELNTLFRNDRTVAALALDLDGKSSTGGGRWPSVNVRSTGWDQVLTFINRDVGANVIEGTATLRRDPAARIRLQGVVALGDKTPMNVAFRRGETGDWWDEQQAAALASGDISRFGLTVRAADLRGGRHQPARPPGPGYYDRVYRSDYPLGEGVSEEGVPGETTATFHYLGRHQPYAVYVPKGPEPHGLQLLLHGASAAHASVVSFPGMQARFGDALNRIIVSPLGRGPNNSYVDWGARDALDAVADVERHYRVDRDAEFISGYSMGGGGTLFLSTLFPDRWAGAVDWVGFTGDCLNGTPFAQGRQREEVFGEGESDPTGTTSNSASERGGCPLGVRSNFIDYMENLRHIPTAHLFAAADELVWANHAVAVMRRSAELGYEHVVWTHAAEHLTFGALDDWAKEAAWTKGRRRVRNPARVTYRTSSYRSMPDLDLVADGAYWVDRMKPRTDVDTPAGDMQVDLTSHMCTSKERTTALEYGAGIDPVPWVSQEAVPSETAKVVRGRRISGTIANVRELTLDLKAACFPSTAKVSWDVDVDGPTLVRFADGRRPLLLRP